MITETMTPERHEGFKDGLALAVSIEKIRELSVNLDQLDKSLLQISSNDNTSREVLAERLRDAQIEAVRNYCEYQTKLSGYGVELPEGFPNMDNLYESFRDYLSNILRREDIKLR